MFPKVLHAIEQGNMLRFGRRLGVAVSGGADSVFLLRALAGLGLASLVLHVNHGLRGEDSEADERFVVSLAGSLGLPISVHSAGSPQTGNLEQEARRARHEFFARVVAEGKVDAVATGHTQSDQAETVLYRFLRGSGTAGLSGIRPVTSSRLIRPMLGISREEVRAALQNGAIPWRDDCSNQDTQFARNQIRLEVLPFLCTSINPAIPEILSATADWAQAEEDFWDGEVCRLASEVICASGETVVLRTVRLRTMHRAVQRRVLRHAVELVRGDLRSIDFRHVEAIRNLVETDAPSGRVQVPGVDAMLSFELLRLAPLGLDGRLGRNFEAALQVPGDTVIPERDLAVTLEPVPTRNVYNNQVNAFDWERCGGALLLRNWQPGDRFHRPGRENAEKIKSLFQEFRIPLWERRSWPVIALDKPNSSEHETVVWARSFGVSAGFLADAASRQAFEVKEHKGRSDAQTAPNVPQVTESIQDVQASIEVARARWVVSQLSAEPGAEVL